MTTLVVPLSPSLAKRLARAADQLGVSHSELATIAVRLFIAEQATNERTNERARRAPAPSRRTRGERVRTRS